MNNNNISDEVRSCVASVFEIGPHIVLETSSPDTVTGWDSLGHLRLIMAVEETFGIQCAVSPFARS